MAHTRNFMPAPDIPVPNIKDRRREMSYIFNIEIIAVRLRTARLLQLPSGNLQPDSRHIHLLIEIGLYNAYQDKDCCIIVFITLMA